jgi:hypothetical protein
MIDNGMFPRALYEYASPNVDGGALQNAYA